MNISFSNVQTISLKDSEGVEKENRVVVLPGLSSESFFYGATTNPSNFRSILHVFVLIVENNRQKIYSEVNLHSTHLLLLLLLFYFFDCPSVVVFVICYPFMPPTTKGRRLLLLLFVVFSTVRGQSVNIRI